MPLLALTQLDVSIQGEEDVASLQVSVDDLVVVEVHEGLQCLLTHHSDLGLCKGPLQLCGGPGPHTHVLSIPYCGGVH